MELIGMVTSRAKILSPAAGGSAEVVQEISKGRVACRVGVVNLTQSVRVGILRRQLPQELDPITKRMTSDQLGFGFLKHQVVCLLGLKIILQNPGLLDGRDC